ncbi:hypothetical protein GMD36_12680 [Parasutterella excrementihominis]|uniref:hypothetical protein n=1 Tax=Parasutterella excrementihominis TaxID=487175 RepID=UPI0012BC925D|nr:hypothetical protein [Parasutterella excrementihominis]MTU19857.1 hypothetical protein [Parasutterella excrementihominis]
MNKKFELLFDDTIEVFGRKLFRIKAKINFGSVKVGEIGGYIEKEENLSEHGDAWVCGDARVYGNAWVYGNARVYGDAGVKSPKDYIVFKNSWSSFRWFTYTKSNKMWKVGCFYGSGQELIEKAYQDSEQSGKCYEAYVNLVLELEKLDD